MNKAAPARIEPSYQVPDYLGDSILLQPEFAELQSGDKTFEGTLRIIQQWFPLACFAGFSTDSPSEIALDDAEVKSSSLKASRVVRSRNLRDGGRSWRS